MGLGREGPGHGGPNLTHLPPRLQRSPGEGSLGQRLCFPDSSYVCGSAVRAQRAGGAGCSLLQHPVKMTTDTEAEGREGAEEQWGWKRRQAHTPSVGALLKPPPRTAGVCTGVGLPVPRRSRSPAGEAGVGLPSHPQQARSLPTSQARTHLLQATATLSCAGSGEPCPPRAGQRLGTPGRRLPGGAHHRQRVAGSPGAAAGGRGAAKGCGPGGATGSGEPSAPLARPPPPPPCFPTPDARPLPLAPAGPVSGLSVEDPPPGASLRLLRRMRRWLLLPASRRLSGGPGDLGTQACWGSALERGKRVARCYPRTRLQAEAPSSWGNDAGLAAGGGAGNRWPPGWEL